MAAFEATSLAIADSFLNGSLRSVVIGQPGGVHAGLHVGHLELDDLVGADGVAERLPLAGVAQALVHAALGQPDGHRRERDAALVQDA